jgi:hypothetical protein
VDHDFTLIEEITAPGDPNDHHHLVDYQTQEMVSTLWSKYLVEAGSQKITSGAAPAMRRVSYSLDNEAFAGQKLMRGIKAAGRSRRAATFAAALWHPEDGRLIHSAEMVTVFVVPGQGAVEIPDEFWAGVEALEGREIPIAERKA